MMLKERWSGFEIAIFEHEVARRTRRHVLPSRHRGLSELDQRAGLRRSAPAPANGALPAPCMERRRNQSRMRKRLGSFAMVLQLEFGPLTPSGVPSVAVGQLNPAVFLIAVVPSFATSRPDMLTPALMLTLYVQVVPAAFLETVPVPLNPPPLQGELVTGTVGVQVNAKTLLACKGMAMAPARVREAINFCTNSVLFPFYEPTLNDQRESLCATCDARPPPLGWRGRFCS